MTPSLETPLNKLVNWSFTLIEQGQISRYGILKDNFYKQYLPGGLELPDRHPPKKIDPRVYNLAYRQYLARLQKS